MRHCYPKHGRLEKIATGREAMKDWKTTVVGVVGALTIIGNQVIALLDNDPTTNISFAAISAALSILGVGVYARDGGK